MSIRFRSVLQALAAPALFTSLAAASAFAQATPPPPPPPDSPTPATPPPAAALPDSPGTVAAPIVPTGPTVVFDTSMGRMTCKLFDKQSPLAVNNFIGLAEGTKPFTDPATGKLTKGVPFYNGTTFHRVIPGFMIQGGDRRGDGTGDAGYAFDNEDTPNLLFDVPGRLAMANAGPNTNGTQFFITELPYPDLNNKYTIFGQCDSHSVLISSTIARVDRNSQDKPLTPVVLNKVTIVREGQPMPPVPPAPAASTTPPAN